MAAKNPEGKSETFLLRYSFQISHNQSITNDDLLMLETLTGCMYGEEVWCGQFKSYCDDDIVKTMCCLTWGGDDCFSMELLNKNFELVKARVVISAFKTSLS